MSLHNYRQKSQSGFTLIEALITISIMGICASIATPSFTNWLSNKKVEDVTAQIEGAIKEAQLESVKQSQACTLSIGVDITSTPTNCLTTGPRDLRKLGIRTLNNNDSGISISTANLGTPATLQFSYKGTIPTLSGGAGTGVIAIYQSTGAASRKMRCIAIASGIGIIRPGTYTGTTPGTPVVNSCQTNIS
jgi:prepilin-type N-terminal cleavage/methylation domain-containing protein